MKPRKSLRSPNFKPAGYHRWHEKWARQSSAATDLIIRGAKIAPGMRVLDLACGSGEPSLDIAKVVGPEGRVVAVDVVEEMLRVAEENAVAAGLTNMSFQLADACKLSFPGGSFDAVTCRFGVMYFTDQRAAMEEVRRVLKPGGRACFVAWGPLNGNPRFVSTYGLVLKSLGEKLGSYRPETFRFDRPSRLSKLMTEAGFRKVSATYRTIPFVWDGPPHESWESFWDLSASFRSLFERVPVRDSEKMKQEIVASMAKYYDGERVNFTAKVVLATCRR